MKFVFYGHNGEVRDLTKEEVHQRLSDKQIKEGIEAKIADPLEEVSYMTSGGFVSVEFSLDF